MRHGSLFSGIGGFDLAAESMGWTNVFHCEWMPFPRKILSHYWPEATSYHDITTTDFSVHRGQIDILTGGFPCQPYSAAGKRKGKDDDRHLWPHMLRCIREVRPCWVVGENVFGLVTWNAGMVFEEVCADLESEGYSVQPFVLPAAAVNAPHRRDRVWFVAYAENSDDREQTGANHTDGSNERGRNSEVWTELARYGDCGVATDADSIVDRGTAVESRTAYQQRRSCETDTSVGNERQFEPIRDVASEGHATYSNSNGLQRCISADFNRQQRSAQINASQCISAYGAAIPFQDFPTVAPICSGDDGLPYELDGITFPKWRNESIKGYGNAIVPQVAMQIFRAIEAYERL